MHFSRIRSLTFLSVAAVSCFLSCTNTLPVKNEVTVQVLADPEMLNPGNTVDATTGYLTSYPLVNNPHAKPYFVFMTDFIFYPEDNLKFTIVSNDAYFLAEATLTDIFILPEYVYDPKGLMRQFTVKQISDKSDSLKSVPAIKEFADDFNSEKRMRDPAFISGSGAYKFTEWKTNERLTLTKKENWWGDALRDVSCMFEAYPEKLI